jgi:hypothetical protein
MSNKGSRMGQASPDTGQVVQQQDARWVCCRPHMHACIKRHNIACFSRVCLLACRCLTILSTLRRRSEVAAIQEHQQQGGKGAYRDMSESDMQAARDATQEVSWSWKLARPGGEHLC